MNKHYISEIKLKSSVNDEKSYISSLAIVQCLSKKKELDIGSDVTFFVGENGTGKSTLVEAIAICAGYNAEGGSKNFNFSTKQTTSNLCHYLTIVKRSHEKDGYFLRAESFYNVASQIDELGINLRTYGGKSLHHQSQRMIRSSCKWE